MLSSHKNEVQSFAVGVAKIGLYWFDISRSQNHNQWNLLLLLASATSGVAFICPVSSEFRNSTQSTDHTGFLNFSDSDINI